MLEALEDRCLFALVITPQPAGASPTLLGNTLLVPNTGLTITGGSWTASGVSAANGTVTAAA